MPPRHKVFLSYHHANDQYYKNEFERRFYYEADVILSGSVGDGDIDENLDTETIRRRIRDEYLRDTSVTVVLIGAETWKRKHVDWEIASSLRHTEYNPRSGLLGILLPTFPRAQPGHYNHRTIPPRLWDNVDIGFAKVYEWPETAADVADWVHDAYLTKSRVQPTLARAMFAKNRSGAEWSD